ncbi:MAG: hypothetical protein Q8937_17700 [Bacteroidota bacterium]|nr:hypothetical protein [Bacteroidota bacterium]
MKKTVQLPIISAAVIGSLAYMMADTIHECLGHGGTCLLLGHKISLLNSVYFRSNTGNYRVDIGGPIANLMAGVLIYALLQKMRNLSFFAKWLLLHAMVYNLCWFSGTMLESIIKSDGDWSHAANELNLSSHITHWLLLLVSVLSYMVFFRMTRSCLVQQFQTSPYSKNQLLLYPYLFAVVASFFAGLFFAGDRWNTAIGGVLELVSSLPLLFIRFKPGTTSGAHPRPFRVSYITAALILFVVFCFTMGKGIVFT